MTLAAATTGHCDWLDVREREPASDDWVTVYTADGGLYQAQFRRLQDGHGDEVGAYWQDAKRNRLDVKFWRPGPLTSPSAPTPAWRR